MKKTNLYFSKCIAMLFLALCFCVPAKGAFSLIHKAGNYPEAEGGLLENGMQKVHTDYQIMYAKPGETVYLYRPERCTFVGYVRWYCYDTDRTVPAWYSAEDSPTDVAIPRIQSTWQKDTVAGSLKFKARNEYGWFGYSLMGPAVTGKATAGDGNFVEVKYTMHKGDSIYRIACDQGIWNDYSPSTWNNNTAMTEPTLSKRTIYEIRPASWMADSLENHFKVTPETPNDNYLEEHKMIAPTGRQLYIGPDMMCLGAPNNGTKVAVGQYTYYGLTNYYYINSQGNVTAAGDKSKWKWYKNGVYDSSITFYAKGAQFAAVSSSTPDTVIYELKYNSATGYYFNVARFTVTYMDVDQVGPSDKIPAPTKKMEKIYEETFNYDRPGTTDFAFWNGYFDVDESTYGYYTQNIIPSNRQTEQNKITWSEYAVTNRKSVWVSSGTAPQVYQHVDSTDNVAANAEEGYMLYCDGSQNPGQVFNLKVNADLCPGSTMYFSAWLCDASSNGSGKSAPNMDFVVTGIDAEGNEHALTTFTTGEFGINAVNKVGEEAKMERGKWYQIMFPVKFEAHTTYPAYRLRITNKSTSSDGNDFAIDDIRIYVQKPPVMPIQASTSDCVDKAVDSIRAYLRIDYQEIDNTVDKLYYQWREGDRILTNAYYNKDSIDQGKPANTFGCLPILPTDEAIEASGLTSANLLAFDAAYRETEEPIYRYIKEKIAGATERYVLYVAQPIEVEMNHNYTGFVATHHESLGTREGCGTYADMIIAGGTRIIIEDHTTLGDSIVSMCGHRTYTLNIALIQIIQDESNPEDPLHSDTTFCRADWLIGDSIYVNEHPEEYGGLTFDQIWNALQLYRSNPASPAKAIIDNLTDDGLFIPDTSAIRMVPSESLSYTAFPLAGSAGSKQVCTSPRFLHIRPSEAIATMMAVGNAGEVLPPRVANKPRVVRISNAQKLRGSFRLPLYLKGEDNDDVYDIERVILEASTNPSWTPVELDFDHNLLGNIDEIELSGDGLTSLEAGYDYTFHIVFQGEETERVGCERGRTYFTLRIVPDVVTWLGGNWNVDFNWSPFIPLEETDVILLPQNYNVTFGDTIYDFGYQKNHCKDIYMPAGMSMASQQEVNIHGQVYLDVPLVAHKWNLTSIPLQGVVSGDIFASHDESTNPFEVADIDHSGTGTTAEDRYGYEIYQSYYEVHQDKWHVPTNKLTSELHPAEAYMIGVATDPLSTNDTAIVRLPKPGSHYHYYDFYTHKWLDEHEDIERNPNYGKPAWNGEPTIALREVYGNVYLLGNPTFGHINIKKLVEDNPDKLTGRYTMPEPTDVEPTRAGMTVFTHKVDTMEEVLLPPLKGILLEGKGEASAELIISISPKDITEPGFAPKAAVVAPRRAKQHASSFNDAGGIPTGAIKSTAEPVIVGETDEDIFDKFDLYHDGIINTLHLNRTLYRDGAFNTLCLPFSMTAGEIDASPIAGVEIYEYVRAEKDGSGLLIYMRPVSSITAGKPYLVKWDMDEVEPIPMPLIFHDVHITELVGDTIGGKNDIRFAGNIAIGTVTEYNENHLFIGAENTLYWPEGDSRLRGFRAHFRVPEDGPVGAPKHTPARLVLMSNVATDVENVQPSAIKARKVIRDGNVYVLRNGKIYSILGQNIK